MVASAKISDKSIHPQEGSNKQKGTFLPFRYIGPQNGHNLAIVGPTEFRSRPFYSSRDSASEEISVIDIK